VANHSLPVPSTGSYRRSIPNLPNNFRQSGPTAPRRIELNDNLSNQRGNRVDNQQLVDIESRLDEIRAAFDKIEQYSEVNRQKRQDHVNRQLMQGNLEFLKKIFAIFDQFSFFYEFFNF